MKRQDYLNSVNLNQDTDFPYLVLNAVDDSSYPRNPGFQVMHWHEDLQFIYVQSGEIQVVTLETSVPLHPGDGIFINKNVVHLVRKSGSCRYKSFIFPDYFLKFYPGGPAGQAVERLAGNKDLPVFYIENREENRAALDRLKALADLDHRKTPLYAYEVLTTLCALWLELCRIVTLPRRTALQSAAEGRMTAFLRYIEGHYSQRITLAALASSAHVSKSECLRCFRAALGTAPYQYLMEYRLSRAAELLRETDAPVGDIAARVGFGQASHFGKCFREKTGLSPSEYRRAKNPACRR